MKFYEMLVNHYDAIFPVKDDALKFLLRDLEVGDRILDAACGTGGYALALAEAGMNIVGVDLDEQMVALAMEKRERQGLDLDFIVSDMRNLDLISTGDLRRIYCIGNSLVHLKTMDDVRSFLKTSFELLKPGGDMVIQIINYDRILDHGIEGLPTVAVPDKDIIFERIYGYDESSHTIDFRSILHVDGETKEASLHLLPLRKDELLRALKEAGFHQTDIQGGFNGEPFNDASMPLVVKAEKAEKTEKS